MPPWEAKGPGWEKVFQKMLVQQMGPENYERYTGQSAGQAPTPQDARQTQSAAASQAARYAFIRREMPDFAKLTAAGYTPLFAYDDPRLADQIRRAREAKVAYGIWADPHGRSAEDFARLMAGYAQQYTPNVIVPDLEAIAKGYEGSAGWQYNADLAAAWKRWLPTMKTAITPMGNQRDFNYEAWKGIASQWLPQAYGADPMKSSYDPNMIRQVLIDRGVDPSIITPVLGPGHGAYWQSYQGPASMWTYDDFMLNQMLPYR